MTNSGIELFSLAASRPLQIGRLVGELRAEVQTLKEEKILEDKKADELQEHLDRLLVPAEIERFFPLFERHLMCD